LPGDVDQVIAVGSEEPESIGVGKKEKRKREDPVFGLDQVFIRAGLGEYKIKTPLCWALDSS